MKTRPMPKHPTKPDPKSDPILEAKPAPVARDRYDTRPPVEKGSPESDPQWDSLNGLVGTSDFRTITKDGSAPIFIVGEKSREGGAKILPRIFINIMVGSKAHKALVNVPLHEVPLLKRLHQHFGGEAEILVDGYPPAIQQVAWMTRVDCDEELRRLRGELEPKDSRPPKYWLPPQTSNGSIINLFNEVYGNGRDGEKSFFIAIGKMAVAWRKLFQDLALVRRKPTPEDIWDIIDIADPRHSVNLIDIPTIDGISGISSETAPAEEASTGTMGRQGDELQRKASGPADNGNADYELVEYLRTQKIPDPVALAFAQVVTRNSGNAPSDEQWKTVLGDLDKNAAARQALLDHLEHFVAKT
jgi:hypothetical protein